MNRPDYNSSSMTDRLSRFAVACLFSAVGTSVWAQNNLNLTASERQQPVDIRADNTDGALDGDGTSRLCGNVTLSQGSLVVKADCAEITYNQNRIAAVKLTGTPVTWNQTVPNTGPVSASASTIDYSVAEGRVELRGDAELHHPTGDLYGEVLVYDQKSQRFQGQGAGDGDQIRVRLESAVFNDDAGSSSGSDTETLSTEPEHEGQSDDSRAATGH